MTRVLVVSGSTREAGSTQKLLRQFSVLFPQVKWTLCESHGILPLFHPGLAATNEVRQWKEDIRSHDVIFIITPEYIYNLPAVIKNALEWVTASGELQNKKVIPCIYTPNSPRGDKAMQSLLWCLQALDANIFPQLSLYHKSFEWEDDKVISGEGVELVEGILELI